MRSLVLAFAFVVTAVASASALQQLSQSDVEQILAQATSRAAQIDQNAIIAITDRAGYVLAVWSVAGRVNANMSFISGAVSRAGTAAFLSSNQEAFTSRTAGYIIQQHFPPYVYNKSNGPLVGVGLSNIFVSADALTKPPKKPPLNLGHSDVNFLKQIPTDVPVGTFNPNIYFAGLVTNGLTVSPGTFGAGVALNANNSKIAAGTGVFASSLNDADGGVPLYKGGELVGGIGVTGDGSPINVSTGIAIVNNMTQSNATPGFKEGHDTDEDVALSGQKGYEPNSSILATNVFIGGIRLPYVAEGTNLPAVRPLGQIGVAVNGFPVQASPPLFNYPAATLGGVDGHIHFEFRSDPAPGDIGSTKRLTASEVQNIISLSAARSGKTRAGIRLPVGSAAQVFITVVGNPAKNDMVPPILGVFRTGDATMFSWDVAVQKARTAIFFSTNNFAQSTRSVGFLAERYYPPGLDGQPPGPYFGLQEALLTDLAKYNKANANIPNGITIFPGGFPLYRNGTLIGAIGVSGDGIDQDDIIAASGCKNFLPNPKIRSDNFVFRGARLPYAKFPRDPGL